MLVPHPAALTRIESSQLARFSLLALSSIFFLVDPFAAIPSFIAITAGVRTRPPPPHGLEKPPSPASSSSSPLPHRPVHLLPLRHQAPRLRDRRRPHPPPHRHRHDGSPPLPPQEISKDRTQEAASKENAGIVPLGIPMLAGPGSHLQRHGPRRPGPQPH